MPPVEVVRLSSLARTGNTTHSDAVNCKCLSGNGFAPKRTNCTKVRLPEKMPYTDYFLMLAAIGVVAGPSSSS